VKLSVFKGLRSINKSTIIMIVLVSSLVTFNLKIATSNEESNISTVISNAVAYLNYTNVQLHVRELKSFSSRVTGSLGCDQAAAYISSKFNSYGLTVINQSYSMAMPIDEGSFITVDSPLHKNITAYALWPNGPQTCLTPPEGITGRLIKGNSLSDFNGHDLNSSIVLMDFNSGDEWIKAADYGARAVIFIEPPQTSCLESLKKAVPIPINIPRLYVNEKDGLMLSQLASRGAVVTVHNRMRWMPITAVNVIGMINGSLYPKDVIVVSAHYDSWSIVPTIAPGAEDALGISSLLEIARYFSNNRPLRTVWFVAFSGYYQALAGPIEWTEEFLYSSEVQHGDTKIWAHIDLDLSTNSNMVDVLYTGGRGPPESGVTGWFGNSNDFSTKFSKIETDMKRYLLSAGVQEYADFYLTRDMRYGTQPPLRDWIWLFRLSSQPTLQTGVLALTIRTQWSYRSSWLTPLDDEKYIRWQNLLTQLKVIVSSIAGLANDNNWDLTYSTPVRLYFPLGGATFIGFVTLKGTVVLYNITTGWYTPMPDILVSVCSRRIPEFYSTAYLVWPFNSRYTFSDSNASFVFHGLVPYDNYGVDAWKFNDTDGSIIYTIDRGIYGTATGLAGGISSVCYPISHPSVLTVPVFECTEITIFDIIDPRTVSHCEIPFTFENGQQTIADHDTTSTPVFYNEMFSPAYDVGMIFVKRGSRVIIMFNPSFPQLRPSIVLSNSTLENTEGYGYSADEPLVIRRTIYEAAKDMYLISNGRYSMLQKRNVRNIGTENLLQKTRFYLQKANTCLSNFTYDRSYSYSLAALALANKAYDGVMSLISESSIFILYFTLITIAFAVFFVSLVFHVEGIKRVLGISGTIILTLLMLSKVTPAFEVISSSVIVCMGIGTMIVALGIIYIFLRDARDIIESVSVTRLGPHLVKSEKTAAMLHSLWTSVENMRRRPLPTTLTMVTLIMFTAAQTAFTSTSSIVSVQETTKAIERVSYQGIMLKRLYGSPTWGGALDLPTLDYLETFTKGEYYISPRIWDYPLSTYPDGVSMHVVNPKGEKIIIAPAAFLGLTSEESILLFDKSLTVGFATLDMPNQAILSKTLADVLNVTVGDIIDIQGTDLHLVVTGITQISSQELMDFDGRSILPLNPLWTPIILRMPSSISQHAPVPEPLSLSNVIIINWKTALDLGGFVSSVTLIPKVEVSLDDLRNVAQEIALSIDSTVYINYGGTMLTLSRLVTYTGIGWENMGILLVIASISIINALIANVQQRRKDIFVYASLGLSPIGAALFFITESLAYASIATVIGYLIGYGLNMLFTTLYPGAFAFNLSSLFIAISLATLTAACVGASIYPSILAYKMITPSLRRKWKLPEGPKGDRWEIFMPIRVVTQEEAIELLNYLTEYYGGMGSGKSGFIVDEILPINLEEMSFSLKMSLIPEELHIKQTVTFVMIPEEKEGYSFFVVIQREAGERKLWIPRNYYVLDDLRKQLLLWESLPLSQRIKYLNKHSG